MLPRAEGELSSPRAAAATRRATTWMEVKKVFLRADPRRADRTECSKDVPSLGNPVSSSRFFPRDSVSKSDPWWDETHQSQYVAVPLSRIEMEDNRTTTFK